MTRFGPHESPPIHMCAAYKTSEIIPAVGREFVDMYHAPACCVPQAAMRLVCIWGPMNVFGLLDVYVPQFIICLGYSGYVWRPLG